MRDYCVIYTVSSFRRPRTTKRLVSHQIYFFLLAQKSFAFLYFDCSGVTVFFGGPPNAFLGAAGALGLDGANWMPAGFDAGAGVGFAAGLAPPPKENGDDFAGAGAGVGVAAAGSYTQLTRPTMRRECRSRGGPEQ